MRTVKFSVMCKAVYDGELEIPDDVKKGDELKYIRENLQNVSIDNLEWIEDFPPEEAVTNDDIRSIEEEEDYER